MDALQQYQFSQAHALLSPQAGLASGFSDDAYRMLDNSPSKMICASEIKWTDFDGTKSSVRSGYHYWPRDARKEALRQAIKLGWTYPRWWQWWRWDDTQPDLDFSARPSI